MYIIHLCTLSDPRNAFTLPIGGLEEYVEGELTSVVFNKNAVVEVLD